MEKQKLTLKDGSIAFIVAFFISQFLIVFGQYIVYFILLLFGYNSANLTTFFQTPYGYILNQLFQFVSFLTVFIFYCKKTTLKKQCFEKKVSYKHLPLFILLGIVTMFSLSYFVNSYTLFLNLINKPSSCISYDLSSTKNYLLSIISLAIFPAIGEELLFRGVILNSYREKGNLLAIMLSSITFTIFHFNLSQLFYPLLFGIILGLIFIFTKNIYVCMIVHFLNNFINLSIQHFSKSTYFSLNSVNLILTIIGIVVFLSLLTFLFYKLNKMELQENNITIVNQKASKPQKTVTINKNPFSIFKNKTFLFYMPLFLMLFFYIIIIVYGA